MEKIVQYLKDHPYSSNYAIASALGMERLQVASLTSPASRSGRLLRRKVHEEKRMVFQYAIGDLSLPNAPDRAGRVPAYRKGANRLVQPTTNGHHQQNELQAEAWPFPFEEAARSSKIQGAVETLVNAMSSSVDAIAVVITDEFMNQLNQRITSRMSELAAAVKAGVHTEPEELVQVELAAKLADAVALPRSKLMSVLILGLTPTQVQLISDEFAEQFDLRFWQDQPSQMLAHAVKSVDLILSCTSKLSHNAIDVLKSRHRELVRIPGGMTQLRNKLTDLYVKLDDAKKGS